MGNLPNTYIDSLIEKFDSIPSDRKTSLLSLKDLIQGQLAEYGESKLNFICTHNSRRSQVCELWLRILCLHYKVPNIKSYSGGTEGTAFNHRMVKAIQSKGLPLTQLSANENPIFTLDHLGTSPLMFSKKYDDENNPSSAFIAVMVCDHADVNCPIVHGADHRFSLQYIDPKFSDNTEEEEKTYRAKVDEVGIEFLFLINQITQFNT